MGAIDVTVKTFFQHFYLVLGLHQIAPWVKCPLCIHNPDLSVYNNFLIFVQFFPRMAPHSFGHHDSPSNLDKSRYPHRPHCYSEVTGTPYRSCTDISNNLMQKRTQASAMKVTKNIIFERMYLVSGLGTSWPWVNCPCAPTTPTVYIQTISRWGDG